MSIEAVSYTHLRYFLYKLQKFYAGNTGVRVIEMLIIFLWKDTRIRIMGIDF